RTLSGGHRSQTPCFQLHSMRAPAPAEDIRTSVSRGPVKPARPRLAVIAAAAGQRATLADLATVSVPAWANLSERAVEPNAYYGPLWANPVARHARGRGHALALVAHDRAAPDRLTGLMPVRWANRSLSLPLPLPMLVSWNAYTTLSVPLLDRNL